MLELLVVEIIVVGTWIGFIAYGAWFFSSARTKAKAQERFSELYNSSKDAMIISARRKRKNQERIARRGSDPEQLRKLVPKPPKRSEIARENPKQNKAVPKIGEMIYCMHCGEQLPSYAIYCRRCGNKVE